jgi:hypothetical protein
MDKIRIELKWAAIFIVMTLVWMVLERLAGLHDAHIDMHPYLTNFIAIPAIAVYVFALREKRERFYGGTMTYAQGFRCGAIITLLVTIITPLSQYIISTVITPDYFANIIRYSVEHGLLTQVTAESTFNLKSYIIQATMFAPVMGLITTAITTAITAAFARTKKTA